MIRERLQGDWPFAASRSPLFYGWIIWAISTLGMLASVPGQTMGMAVFTDAFIDAFGLSRTELSAAYLFGTLTSAILLTSAGRAFDRYGARIVLTASVALLGLVLLAMAYSADLAHALATATALPLVWFSWPLIYLCYFGVRFSGQGVLSMAATNMLLLWFERRRGFVVGIRGVFVALGFSIAPAMLAPLIDARGWQGALLTLSAVVGLGYLSLVLLLARDRPEASGLAPDGDAPETDVDTVLLTNPDQTLHQAQRTRIFWAYSLGLALHALFGTAFTFHIVDLFALAGRSRAEAFAYFIPAAVLSTVTNLLCSTLADRISLKPLQLLMLSLFATGAYGLVILDQPLGYALLLIGYGVGGGLWNVLASLAFIRHHGRRFLGEISGFHTSITVVGSALGPILFSVSRDATGDYASALWLSIVAFASLIVFSWFVPHTDPISRRTRPAD